MVFSGNNEDYQICTVSTDVAEHTSEKLRQKTFDRAINLLTYRARSVEEMRERLLEKEWADRGIVDQVIEKLLAYGTGAAPTTADRAEVEKIVKKSREKNYGLRSLVHEVVQSRVFRTK